MKILKYPFLFAAFLLCFATTQSLAANGFQTIVTDGDRVTVGKITQLTEDSIIIETREGETETIPTSQILTIDYQGKTIGLPAPGYFRVYLKNGEIIDGTISQFTSEFLTLESPNGYGVLQIPLSSVSMIISKDYQIDLNQRDGIGYVQRRSTLDSPSGMSSYTTNQISYKFFLGDNMFGNALLAYGNTALNDNKLQIMSFDYRMGLIFKKTQFVLAYTGASIGYMQIKDDSQDVDGAGTGYGVFLGAEILFPTLPNFGFSGEIGYNAKKVDDYEVSDLSISSFPAFSVHYYF